MVHVNAAPQCFAACALPTHPPRPWLTSCLEHCPSPHRSSLIASWRPRPRHPTHRAALCCWLTLPTPSLPALQSPRPTTRPSCAPLTLCLTRRLTRLTTSQLRSLRTSSECPWLALGWGQGPRVGLAPPPLGKGGYSSSSSTSREGQHPCREDAVAGVALPRAWLVANVAAAMQTLVPAACSISHTPCTPHPCPPRSLSPTDTEICAAALREWLAKEMPEAQGAQK